MINLKTKGNRVTLTVDFELTDDLLTRAANDLSMEIEPDPKSENLVEALAGATCITRFLLTRTIAELTGKTFLAVDTKLGKRITELNKTVKTKTAGA